MKTEYRIGTAAWSVEKIHKEKSKNFCLKVADWTYAFQPLSLDKKKKPLIQRQEWQNRTHFKAGEQRDTG